MSDVTDQYLREIEERCEKATPGPWTRARPTGEVEGFKRGVGIASVYGRQMIWADPPGGQFPSSDAEFIAHARTDVPRLIGALREARKLNKLLTYQKDSATRIADCVSTELHSAKARIAELEARCGAAAAAIIEDDKNEAYHQMYLALVRDLTLPAEEQASIMQTAIRAAMAREPRGGAK